METGETEREELEVEGLVGVFVDEHHVGKQQTPRERIAAEEKTAQRLEIAFVGSMESANFAHKFALLRVDRIHRTHAAIHFAQQHHKQI